MFFTNEDRVRLGRLLDLVEGEDRAVKALERRIACLEEQNKDLFDRLMARDWDAYAMKVAGDQFRISELSRLDALSPEMDEDNAGVIMEISDDTEE